jgi:methylated-DNA-protein-cysteine methyltransferase-like protein
MAGDPRGARQVVRILHALSDRCRLPWHRVINARGRIGLRDPVEYQQQRALLAAEGVVFDRRGVVDLYRYSWTGE